MGIVYRIQMLCEKENITLTQLERILEIGKGVIRNWDKHSPSCANICKVADYFKVTTDYLLGRSLKETVK